MENFQDPPYIFLFLQPPLRIPFLPTPSHICILWGTFEKEKQQNDKCWGGIPVVKSARSGGGGVKYVRGRL